MHDFLWASGHLGWGVFAIVTFSCLWLLASDLYCRLQYVRFRRFLVMFFAGWIVGVVLVVWAVWLSHR